MSAANINIVTFNVRGLRNSNKRLALFEALKEHNVHIALLQETYITEDLVPEVDKGFGGLYHCIHSCGSVHSRGVTALIKINSDIQITNHVVDDEGRLILLNVMVNKYVFTVLNVYAPNLKKTKKKFFC